MQCNQLIRLMKDWYLHVKEETMAPARMMQFTDKHISNCDICQQDSGLLLEIEKIREFVLPEAKIPKSERNDEEELTPEISPGDEEQVEESGENSESGENDENDLEENFPEIDTD